ncbi:uncharacterized protein EHS24_004181 [Apiotrichum porosum]|uniref:Ubiquitin-like domain-containing protein n=1 Tax=Apiotrichum porosum TaxID=105984 RepID=A0A427Y4I3_9TREE|nr:uncharacterized protein EHS24_004181 [Apiotrichum porosum]RSH85994.1 hypothetical protein EHS24_004181 [Apiotrichum porosum]
MSWTHSRSTTPRRQTSSPSPSGERLSIEPKREVRSVRIRLRDQSESKSAEFKVKVTVRWIQLKELYARQHSDMDPTSLRLILEGNRVDLTPDSVIADSLDEDTVEGEVITVDVVLER